MSDAWKDTVLVEAFDAAITKYQQMHGLSIMKESVASQGLEIFEKEDEGRVDSQPADSEERVYDLSTEPRHQTYNPIPIPIRREKTAHAGN